MRSIRTVSSSQRVIRGFQQGGGTTATIRARKHRGVRAERSAEGAENCKNIANQPENGIIKIKVEELTPCLKRMSDGQLVNTSVVGVIPTKTQDLELWPSKKGARKNYMIDTMAENPLDNFGALTDPFSDSSPGYNFKRIREYCRETGKEFTELTYEEFDMFKSITESAARRGEVGIT